ncbi:MAG: phage portal protein [Patescibacteria group bacterium]
MKLVHRFKDAYDVLTNKKSLLPASEIIGAFFGDSGDKGKVYGWQYKASRLLAEEVGSIPLHLYQVKNDASWDEINTHPLLELLDRPNPDQIRSEFMETLSMHLDFYGNAYIYLEKQGNKIVHLYALHPSGIKVERTGFPGTVKRYHYTYNEINDKTIERDEIIHIRETNPDDPLKGKGPIEAVYDSVYLDKQSRVWNKAFFKNSARPDLYLKTKYTSRAQTESLKAQFEDAHRGATNAGRIAVLPEGVEPESAGWNQKDIDFVEQLRFTRDDILSALRTPHVVLGLGAGENLNRATAETTDYVYALRTIKPRIKRITAYLNAYLLPKFGEKLILDFDDPVPENEEMNIRKRQASLGNAPYQSINEVRDEMGLQPIKNGDSVMGPFNLAPIGQTQDKKTPQKNIPQRIHKAINDQNKLDDKVNKVVGGVIKSLEARMEKQTEDMKEAEWKTFVSRVQPYENQAQKFMSDYSEAMTERAVSALEKEMKAVGADDLLDKDEEMGIIIDGFEPIMAELMAAEGAYAAELVGGAFDPALDPVKEAIKQSVRLMAESFTETTLELLENQLNEGISAGEGIGELAKRIREVGEFSSQSRAKTVARTESYRIANKAAKEAYIQSSIEELIWYTAGDERVCEFCGPMDGKVVKTTEVFFKLGDEVQGSEGGKMQVKYSDIEGGALHPGCRCQIRANI